MSTSCFKGGGHSAAAFAALMPDRVTTLGGSVTVPCSFTLRDGFEDKLTSGCKPIWLKDYQRISAVTFRGNLTAHNCTTTFNNVHDDGSYTFGMECLNFRLTFLNDPVIIQVMGKCNVCVSETNMLHKSYWSYCGSNDADCW